MWRCGDGGGECCHYEYFPTRRLGSQAAKRRLGSHASIGKTISGQSSCRKRTNSGRRRVVDPDLDGAPSARSSSVGLTADLWRPPPDELTHLDEERPRGNEESEAVSDDDDRDRGAGGGRLLVPGSQVPSIRLVIGGGPQIEIEAVPVVVVGSAQSTTSATATVVVILGSSHCAWFVPRCQ